MALDRIEKIVNVDRFQIGFADSDVFARCEYAFVCM